MTSRISDTKCEMLWRIYLEFLEYKRRNCFLDIFRISGIQDEINAL
jgi:hypothetical protein